MNADRIMIVSALAIQKPLYAVDDTDIGLVVKYVGSEDSATVTVASGDITFQHGDLASEAVDATIDSGTDDEGVIDVSDANANTFGEVVGLINASPNWEAKVVDALNAELTTTASLLARGETTIVPNQVLPLYKDTSDGLDLVKNISAMAYEVLKGADGNPWSVDEADYINSLFEWFQLNTFASEASTMTVYERDPATLRETLLLTLAGAATTVVGNRDFTSAGNGWGLMGAKGCELLVKMTGVTYCTGSLLVFGGSRKFGY